MDLFTPVEDRLGEILWGGRGVGSADPIAAARAIPNTPRGRFRRALQNKSLDDIEYPAEAFDRAVEFRWTTLDDDPGPQNDYDEKIIEAVRLDLVVGYVYGSELPALVSAAPGTAETAAWAVAAAQRRALNDARRIRRTCTYLGLLQQDGDDPWIVNAAPDGASANRVLGGGRLVCTTPLRLTLETRANGAYDR